MDHRAHQPGTVADCPDCQALAVEPAWYKAMRDERVLGTAPSSVLIPDAAGQTVEAQSGDAAGTGVVLPDLEETRPDDLA